MAKSLKEESVKGVQPLTASNIKYLITMLSLSKTPEDSENPNPKGVRGIDIASELGIAKPSAHTMLENLAERGYIDKGRYGAAYFTAYGLETANRYNTYFEILYEGHRDIFKDRRAALGPICSMLAELPYESLRVMENARTEGVGCP